MTEGNRWEKTKIRLHVLGVGCLPILIVFVPGVIIFLRFLGVCLHETQIKPNLTYEDYNTMQWIFNTPIKIPEVYQQVEPFPEEVLAAARSLHEAWEDGTIEKDTSVLTKLQNQETLSEEEIECVHSLAAQHEPYVQQLTQLVEIPEYDFEALVPTGDQYLPEWIILDTLTDHILISAYHHDMGGQNSRAISEALLVIQLTSRHSGSRLPTHLLANSFQRNASTCLSNLFRNSSDANALKNVLDELVNLHKNVVIIHKETFKLVDIVGELRHLKRKGVNVDLSREEPLASFWREWLVELSKQENKNTKYEKLIPMKYKLLQYSGGRQIIEELIYVIKYYPEDIHLQYNSRYASITLDLATLADAQKIAELEEKDSLSRDDIIRVLGHPEPLDPFTGKPYSYHNERKQFYSIGPDMVDDCCSKKCTSVGGEGRLGDVFLPFEIKNRDPQAAEIQETVEDPDESVL